MYLSKLILNPMDRMVWRDRGDCCQMHRTIMRAFPEKQGGDRKSTRLNSSHVRSSYAVFCLNKKTGSDELPSGRALEGSRCDRRQPRRSLIAVPAPAV